MIMVVEDDESVQSIVEEALSDGGFEPAAASGEEAVTLLKGRLTKYRALVTDIIAWHDGRLGSREARQRDRSGISRRLYDRCPRRRLWFAGRSEQHPVDQAVCGCATCHRRFPALERRDADNVRRPQLAMLKRLLADLSSRMKACCES